jgi:hypothetical protein
MYTQGVFHEHDQTGQIVDSHTKRLGFGPIWPEHLDKIRMRSSPDLSIDAETNIRVWLVRSLNGKRPQLSVKIKVSKTYKI